MSHNDFLTSAYGVRIARIIYGTAWKKGRTFFREHQIIYQSFWTLTANPNVLAHAALQTLAVKYRRSGAQIFFRDLSQIDIIPLTATTSESHMRGDLTIIDFELNSDECGAVEILLCL